ncbi:translocation protein [Wolfiporia cocos MD-104 SS10]|uniref:Translocation protein SEC62 n=1 Tax=Wolfiporia cocos (strain MD-104) TaxID=742152 RepID=A0A2H3IZL3_WOLCO|nr:translocation protein [Wolfiporia cocos MD-104 SS10]
MEQQAKAPQDLRNVVNFLRSSKSGMKVRVGILSGKRIDYFKGRSAAKALLSPAYAKLKNVPPVTSEADAMKVMAGLLPFAFFLRVERGSASSSSSSAPKLLSITPIQQFAPLDYYAWFYEGSQWTTYIGGVAMVAVMLAGVMFPLWPPVMRLGVWYISMAVLGLVSLFFALAIVRLIFYIITVIVASPGIWIFPKLFADVGFVESFIPLWEWDLPKKKSRKRRTEKEQQISTTTVEVIEADSGSSRPSSRNARVEDVPEES